MEEENDIIEHLKAFEYFGIPKEYSYKESVEELIYLHYELLKDKYRSEKQKFRQNLYNITRLPN